MATATNGGGAKGQQLANVEAGAHVPGKEIEKSGAESVRQALLKSKDQIQMALPKHMTADRMMRIALTAIRSNKSLLDCSITSLMKCVVQAAGLGLELDPIMGRAYMVPFKGEATLIIGYKGFIDLARRSGEIESIQAQAVHERDYFEYEYGLNERLKHMPAFDNRGAIVFAWALAKFKGGGHQFEVMDIDSLERIRRMSKKPNDGPWRDHTEEMYRKTVVRRLSKYLPLSPELLHQLDDEDRFLYGEPEGAAPVTVRPGESRSSLLARQIESQHAGEPEPAAEPEAVEDDILDAALAEAAPAPAVEPAALPTAEKPKSGPVARKSFLDDKDENAAGRNG